jgi:D-sedoheptulose 7-phosphate isomerase
MNTLDELWAAAGSPRDYVGGYREHLAGLLEQLDLDTVASVINLLEEACRQGRTIFCVGNGGSAATAAHLATDLQWGRKKRAGKLPRVISLTTNVPTLTAVANDVGYAEIFVEQLRGLFQPHDVLVAISASGNSENLLRAIEYANTHGGISVGLVGFDGGRMKSACAVCVHVEARSGDYELVEDAHHAICHMMASYVRRRATRQPRAELSGSAR